MFREGLTTEACRTNAREDSLRLGDRLAFGWGRRAASAVVLFAHHFHEFLGL